jgi:hypothetical protein
MNLADPATAPNPWWDSLSISSLRSPILTTSSTPIPQGNLEKLEARSTRHEAIHTREHTALEKGPTANVTIAVAPAYEGAGGGKVAPTDR